MIRRLDRSYYLWMSGVAVSTAASGLAVVGCEFIWGIEPIDPCQFHYDNDAGLNAGVPKPFDGGALCATSSSSSSASAGDGGTGSSSASSSAGSGGGEGGGGLVPCSSLMPPPIFVYGSDSVVPILKQIGPALANSKNRTATVIYQEDRSCKAIDAIFDPQRPKKTGTACYYPAEGGSGTGACADVGGQECTLDPEGLSVDIGVSDIFPETCDPSKSSDDPAIVHQSGPIQAAIFVTAATSSQEVISWEAAHATYDPKSSHVATPWNDEAFVFQRITASGTQRLMATLFGLDPDQCMRGKSFPSSTNLIDQIRALDGSKDDDKILGVYDVVNSDERTKTGVMGFKTLAFQPKGGTCGFKPDISGYDKTNVRNGNYVVWSPLHFVRRTVSGNSEVKKVVDLILMGSDLADVRKKQVFATWVTRGFVPDCAMAVHREAEMGPLEPKTPLCTCAFEQTLKLTTEPGCEACDPNNPNCMDGYHCDQTYGFCEPNNQDP